MVEERIKGCLFGGAIGDALGAPVEFISLVDIEEQYGKITDFITDDLAECALFTDDTQMTIMTAYGLISSKNEDEYLSQIFSAYVNWANISKNRLSLEECFPNLRDFVGLFEDRQAGDTCMRSLLNAESGVIGNPLANSKGNGGVMRVAPIGLVYSDPKKAFIIGMKVAHLTHGHLTSDVSSGSFTALISLLLYGNSLETAISKMIKLIEKFDENKETLTAIQKAIEYAKDPTLDDRLAIFKLGLICDGFIAEEALAIAIYCALTTDSYKEGVIKAVNISGDSDTIGAICGNILGALYGLNGIPQEWQDKIELRELLEKLSLDLALIRK